MNNPKMSDELREIRDNARRDFLVVTCEKELVRQPTEHELEIMGKIPWNIAFNACFEAMSKTHVPKEKVEVLVKALDFYSNRDNYDREGVCEHNDNKGTDWWVDYGYTATKALKEFKESEE